LKKASRRPCFRAQPLNDVALETGITTFISRPKKKKKGFALKPEGGAIFPNDSYGIMSHHPFLFTWP